ncbi:Methyl-CpG-binding domain-containing protein 13 [Quillaja saponaria]|uniref:Methyl-CpG-binding domain-containing protein 13 n=1 Tax=Quillaja saponaria TaxID=32244 RepID=A0AAD7Q6E8_QUISA|nr:Methyl-CpG-binding domain-containing protein 13 [Quillaja saponaria]
MWKINMQYKFYTDPLSGYVFCSMKDTLRYLETGELGRLALKPKDKRSSDVELEDDKFFSPSIAKKPKSAVSRARRQIFFGQSSNMDRTLNGNLILDSACVREFPAVGASPGEKLPESALIFHESEKARHGQRKFKHKKETNLPRRASRRLAGLEPDPVPELKSSKRELQALVIHSGEGVPSTDDYSSNDRLFHRASLQIDVLGRNSETKSTFGSCQSNLGSPMSSMIKNSCRDLATPVKLAGKFIEENRSDKDEGCKYILPPDNRVNLPVHVTNVEIEEKSDKKPDYSLDLPLGELLTDPCIAFAIQTLTGMNFETSKNSLVSSESSDSKQSGNLSAAEEHGKKVKGKNNIDEKQGCTALLPPESLAITEESAGKVENVEMVNENSGSSLELPFRALWMDPCIEFAIKTLTDSIPIDYDPNIQNCFPQQLSSLETQGNSELTLPSVDLDSFCQSDISCHKNRAIEKPVFKQQHFAEPALPHTRNVSLQSSGGSILLQTSEHRTKES